MKIKKSIKYIILLSLLFITVISSAFYLKVKSKDNLLSVVVPVYNAEKYLPKCLDSLLNQTYKGLEIICINDGSKDNSLEILNEYKKNDKRIKIINKENAGVSAARNDGINIAHGRYITFVDPDDYLDTDVYEKCLDLILKNDADMLAFECIYEPSHNSFIKLTDKKYTDPFNAIDDREVNTGFVWNKIFKKSIITKNNIWFAEDIASSEDNLFVNMVMTKTNVVVTKPGVFYHYLYNQKSPAKAVPMEKRLDNAITRCKYIIDYYEKEGYTNRYDWLLNHCLEVTFEYIDTFNNPQIQKTYSIKFLDILDNRLLNRISEVPQSSKEQINKLISYANL